MGLTSRLQNRTLPRAQHRLQRPPPTEQAKVEPPAAAAPAPPPAHTAKRAHSAAAEPPPAPAPPAVASQMPPEPEASAPEPMDQVEVTREAHRTFRTEAQQAPPEYATGAMRPAYSQQDTGAREANQEQAEQEGQTEEQRQAGEETSRRRSFKSKAAPAAAHGTDAAPPSRRHANRHGRHCAIARDAASRTR